MEPLYLLRRHDWRRRFESSSIASLLDALAWRPADDRRLLHRARSSIQSLRLRLQGGLQGLLQCDEQSDEDYEERVTLAGEEWEAASIRYGPGLRSRPRAYQVVDVVPGFASLHHLLLRRSGRGVRNASRHVSSFRLPGILLLFPGRPVCRCDRHHPTDSRFESLSDCAWRRDKRRTLEGPARPAAQFAGWLFSLHRCQSGLGPCWRLSRRFPFAHISSAAILGSGIGTIVSVFMAPALFMLFAKAYPCIVDLDETLQANCPFSAPSVSAWRAVTVAITDPEFPVPTSSGIFSIIFSIFGAIMVIIRHYAYTGKWAKYRVYHPNMMCIGLAFVLPQTVYGTAMVMGAVPAYFWAKRAPKHFDIYGYAVAAGLIAGEGIGGVINAIFQIAGIAGPSPYGTNIACPYNSC